MNSPFFKDPMGIFKRNPLLASLWALVLLWVAKSFLFAGHFLAFAIYIGLLLLIAFIVLRNSPEPKEGKSPSTIKKEILYISLGLVAVWVVGIVLVNVFNFDIDRFGNQFNSNFFLIIFGAVGVFILFLTGIGLFRMGSEGDRAELSEDERKSAITRNFSLGVSLPLGLGVVFAFVGGNLKNYFDPKYDASTTFFIGTFLSITGLPFIIRMLRLIRDELKAVRVALLLVPYGILLWGACLLLLMVMFARHGCC